MNLNFLIYKSNKGREENNTYRKEIYLEIKSMDPDCQSPNLSSTSFETLAGILKLISLCLSFLYCKRVEKLYYYLLELL